MASEYEFIVSGGGGFGGGGGMGLSDFLLVVRVKSVTCVVTIIADLI
jgi:hypothetical protein